jgi:hypothetical protein
MAALKQVFKAIDKYDTYNGSIFKAEELPNMWLHEYVPFRRNLPSQSSEWQITPRQILLYR